MRELRLKYFIDLVSNLGPKAKQDAKAMADAQAVMTAAITGTNSKWLDYNKLTLLAGKNTALMQEVITGATNKFAALDRAITQVGHNTSLERQAQYVHRLAQGIDAVYARSQRLAALGGRIADAAPQAAGAAVGGYYAGRSVVAPPLKAYANLEQATMDLRIAMTDKRGQVSPEFGRISAEAVTLGNQLPGTTKDYMRAARALQTQGVPSAVIANGGLRASSYVGALLGLDQERAAEVIAKIREAHGLKDSELVPMADLVQRGFFGFGIKPQDYLETAKYAAATYNTMGITGYQKTRETLAIQGMAANVGLEASSFGTNYAQMLTRLAQIEPRLAKKSKEAKEAKALLGEHGIDMSFYGDDGAFKGNLNMLQQLAKMRALNPLQQTRVLHQLFGVEGGRPAQILVQKGLEGYQAALGTLDNQGDLNTRLAMSTSTLQSKFESLTGTVENVAAKMATALGNALKSPIDRANDALGGVVSDALDRHPVAASTGLVAAGGLGAWLTARMGWAGVGKLLGRGAAAGGGEAAAAAAGAAAPGLGAAATLGAFLRRTPLLGPMIDVLGTSDAEMEILRNADRMREGYRGKGFVDPRLITSLPRTPGTAEMLAFTAPGGNAAPLQIGTGVPGLTLGDGRLEVAVHVTDDRVTATAHVAKPLSGLRIDAGNTNPAWYSKP